MDNAQLSAAISRNLPATCVEQFLGCLTVDELEYLSIPYTHDPLFIIVNILPRSKIKLMGHWVLLYIKSRVIRFFDSFALHPNNYSVYFRRFFQVFQVMVHGPSIAIINFSRMWCVCFIFYARDM